MKKIFIVVRHRVQLKLFVTFECFLKLKNTANIMILTIK